MGPAGENGNRIVLLGQPGVNMHLPTVFFNNEDEGEYGERMVTFNVDLTDAAASGMFAPQFGDRVVVTGPFNNWCNNEPDFMEQVGDTLIFMKNAFNSRRSIGSFAEQIQNSKHPRPIITK